MFVQWITDQGICGSLDRLFQLFGQFRDLFVDDILVYSRSEAELVKHFRVVLETLRVGQIGKLGLSTVWQRCVATCDQIRVAQWMRDVSEFVVCCHLGNRD